MLIDILLVIVAILLIICFAKFIFKMALFFTPILLGFYFLDYYSDGFGTLLFILCILFEIFFIAGLLRR